MTDVRENDEDLQRASLARRQAEEELQQIADARQRRKIGERKARATEKLRINGTVRRARLRGVSVDTMSQILGIARGQLHRDYYGPDWPVSRLKAMGLKAGLTTAEIAKGLGLTESQLEGPESDAGD